MLRRTKPRIVCRSLVLLRESTFTTALSRGLASFQCKRPGGSPGRHLLRGTGRKARRASRISARRCRVCPALIQIQIQIQNILSLNIQPGAAARVRSRPAAALRQCLLRAAAENGFAWPSSSANPRPRKRSVSAAVACAVESTTGRVCPAARSAASVPTPSNRPIHRFISTSSNGAPAANAVALYMRVSSCRELDRDLLSPGQGLQTCDKRTTGK
jgi:hypothetical protein